MMTIEIQLTDKQPKQMTALAEAEGVSVADLTRLSIDKHNQGHPQSDREELKRKSLPLIGRYSSGLDDVGKNHDECLADIYAGRVCIFIR